MKGVRTMRDAAGLALQMTGLVFPLPGLHYTQREPWGVVGRLITFNHPAMYACARLGSALVAGNCIVLKPSELAPLATLAIGELTAGILPDGVVSVVVGGPATVTRSWAPHVQRISFREHADRAADPGERGGERNVEDALVRVGGKNPIVVFPDVDRDEVAAAIVRGMNYTRVQGQSCGSTSGSSSTSRSPTTFSRASLARGQIKVGMRWIRRRDGRDDHDRRARPVHVRRAAAVGVGARVVTGATVPSDPALRGGAFLAPTVVAVSPRTPISRRGDLRPVLQR